MPTEVILPQLGESVAEGVITHWLKQPGDRVEADEPLVEITTDKVNVELPAPVAGIVQELRAREGETVPVEQVIAVIGETEAASAPAHEAAEESGAEAKAAAPAEKPAEETAEAAKPAETALAPSPVKAAKGEEEGGNGAAGRYSPLVRRIARENSLNLDFLVATGQVTGSGEGGRVTKNDILAYLSRTAGQPGAAPPSAEARETGVETARHAPVTGPDVVPATPPTVTPAPKAAPTPAPVAAAPEPSETPDEIVVPFTGIRKMIADHLVRAAFTAPHVTTVALADVTKLVAFRAANRESWEKDYGVKLTYTPFFVKATCDALLAFPMINATIQGDSIVARKYVHLGVAVSLGEGGLIVPVIKNAHQKDLVALAREIDDLAKRARAGQLAPADVQGGTFTLTNPGVFGAILSTPIINAPQSAILGVEAIQKMPVVREDDSLAIRSMMYLCLSYDHRVIDGETAIRFLQHLRQTLEEFRFFR
jgi:pyruvate/2-oxoglutarate dehydrogenase complex dihydrolipoamide acyltransferase (E2) component